MMCVFTSVCQLSSNVEAMQSEGVGGGLQP